MKKVNILLLCLALFLTSCSMTNQSKTGMQETPYSTCFSSIGYHPIWEGLVVVFRDSGYRYRYYDVPQEIGQEFLDSADPGEYHNEVIKGRYDCDRLD